MHRSSLVLVAGVLSCSSADGSYSPGAALQTYGASLCAKLEACCGSEDLYSLHYISSPDTELTCYPDSVTHSADVNESAAAGRLRIHADRVAACARAIDAASCEAFGQMLTSQRAIGPECETTAMFEPLVEDGECGGHRECKSGWCASVSPYSSTSYCDVVPQAGSSCSVNSDCPTNECSILDGFLCVGPFGDGASCAADRECRSRRCFDGVCTSTAPYCAGRSAVDGGAADRASDGSSDSRG